MNFEWKETKTKLPIRPGRYLVIRNNHRTGEAYPELISFDGRFWITGIHDDPEALIELWSEIPEYASLLDKDIR